MAIKKFEYLDGNLAAVIESVPELRGGKLSIWRLCSEISGNLHHFSHRAPKKEMIMRHLVDLAEAAEQLEQPTDVVFTPVDHADDVAHARRAKALLRRNQRFHVEPQRLLGASEPHFVVRQPDPGAVQCYLLCPRQGMQGRSEGRCRQPWLKLQPKPLQARTKQIRIVGMKRRKSFKDAALELVPAFRRHRDHCALQRNGEFFCKTRNFVCAERTVSGKCCQVDVTRGTLRQRGKRTLTVVVQAGVELRNTLRCPTLARGSAQVEKTAAANGALRRRVAHDEAIAHSRGDRSLQHELDAALPSRRDWPLAQQNDPRTKLRGGMVQAHGHPLGDRLWLTGKHAQCCIDPVGGRMELGIQHHVATMDGVLGDAVAREIESAALTGLSTIGRAILRVD